MEDYVVDLIIGKGPAARSIPLSLSKFTLIGATTRAGQISTPLRDRFGVVLKLELYSVDDLATIVKRSAGILKISIENTVQGNCRPFKRNSAYCQQASEACTRFCTGQG